MLRYALIVTYVLAWTVSWASLAFLLAAPLAALLNSSHKIDDDWLWLMLPVGAAFGTWFAIRTRGWRVLHLVCFLVGLAAAVACFLTAHELAAEAEAVVGVTGPLAGLGETILSLIAIVLGVTSLLVATGGGTGMLLRWGASKNK